MDVTDYLTGGNEDESAALIEALRAQQEEQQRERMGLQDTLRRQQGQAGGLRTLSLLTSMGDNPLLRGLQQASGQQGAQMEGLAGRTEQRLAGLGSSANGPLSMLRLRQAQERIKQAALEAQAKERRFQQGLKQSAEQGALNRDAAKERAAIFAGQKNADDLNKEVQKFGDEVVKSGAPGFYERYDIASKLLEKYKDDLPGFGRIEGRLPDEAISDDGRSMRQAIGQLLSEYRKGQSGAGMSDSERAEYGRITGLLQTGDETSVRQGIEQLRAAMDSRLKATAGGYTPEAVKTYTSRVPRVGSALKPDINLDAPPAKAPAQASGGSVLPPPPAGKVRVRIGGKVGLIPREKLEAAKARGAVEVQ